LPAFQPGALPNRRLAGRELFPPPPRIVINRGSDPGDIALRDNHFEDHSDDVIPPTRFTINGIEGDADAVNPEASLADEDKEMDSVNVPELQKEDTSDEQGDSLDEAALEEEGNAKNDEVNNTSEDVAITQEASLSGDDDQEDLSDEATLDEEGKAENNDVNNTSEDVPDAITQEACLSGDDDQEDSSDEATLDEEGNAENDNVNDSSEDVPAAIIQEASLSEDDDQEDESFRIRRRSF